MVIMYNLVQEHVVTIYIQQRKQRFVYCFQSLFFGRDSTKGLVRLLVKQWGNRPGFHRFSVLLGTYCKVPKKQQCGHTCEVSSNVQTQTPVISCYHLLTFTSWDVSDTFQESNHGTATEPLEPVLTGRHHHSCGGQLSLPSPSQPFPALPSPSQPFPALPSPSQPFPALPSPSQPFPALPRLIHARCDVDSVNKAT